jgi:hypothetical protein
VGSHFQVLGFLLNAHVWVLHTSIFISLSLATTARLLLIHIFRSLAILHAYFEDTSWVFSVHTAVAVFKGGHGTVLVDWRQV